MPYVVTLDKMPGSTSGEAAAVIAGPECPVNGGREAAGLAADVQRHAIGVFRKAYDARVAGQAPGAFTGERGSVLELRAARGVRIGEYLGVHPLRRQACTTMLFLSPAGREPAPLASRLSAISTRASARRAE